MITIVIEKARKLWTPWRAGVFQMARLIRRGKNDRIAKNGGLKFRLSLKSGVAF